MVTISVATQCFSADRLVFLECHSPPIHQESYLPRDSVLYNFRVALSYDDMKSSSLTVFTEIFAKNNTIWLKEFESVSPLLLIQLVTRNIVSLK